MIIKKCIIFLSIFLLSCTYYYIKDKNNQIKKIYYIKVISPKAHEIIQQNELIFKWCSIPEAYKYILVLCKIDNHSELTFYNPVPLSYRPPKSTPDDSKNKEYYNIVHEETIYLKTNIKFQDFCAKFNLDKSIRWTWTIYAYNKNNIIIGDSMKYYEFQIK